MATRIHHTPSIMLFAMIFIFSYYITSTLAEKPLSSTPTRPVLTEDKDSKETVFTMFVERCVMLAFDPHSPILPPLPASEDDQHRKYVHLAAENCRSKSGDFPPVYIRALEKVPRFKKHKRALIRYFCGLKPPYSYGGIPCPSS